MSQNRHGSKLVSLMRQLWKNPVSILKMKDPVVYWNNWGYKELSRGSESASVALLNSPQRVRTQAAYAIKINFWEVFWHFKRCEEGIGWSWCCQENWCWCICRNSEEQMVWLFYNLRSKRLSRKWLKRCCKRFLSTIRMNELQRCSNSMEKLWANWSAMSIYIYYCRSKYTLLFKPSI